MGAQVSGFTSLQWDKVIEPSIQKFTIAVAEQALRNAVQGGFDNEPVVITDGITRRDYYQVKPFGKIEFARRPILAECARWIMAQLIERSPVGPGRNGHYKDKHVLMINRAQVDDSALDNLKPTDRVQIVNTQPYAKKLEGGSAVRARKEKVKRSRGSSAQAPGGIYQPVMRAAYARYGRTLFIDFTFVQLNLSRPRVMRRRGHGRKLARPYAVNPVYPCINLYIKTLNG